MQEPDYFLFSILSNVANEPVSTINSIDMVTSEGVYLQIVLGQARYLVHIFVISDSNSERNFYSAVKFQHIISSISQTAFGIEGFICPNMSQVSHYDNANSTKFIEYLQYIAEQKHNSELSTLSTYFLEILRAQPVFTLGIMIMEESRPLFVASSIDTYTKQARISAVTKILWLFLFLKLLILNVQSYNDENTFCYVDEEKTIQSLLLNFEHISCLVSGEDDIVFDRAHKTAYLGYIKIMLDNIQKAAENADDTTKINAIKPIIKFVNNIAKQKYVKSIEENLFPGKSTGTSIFDIVYQDNNSLVDIFESLTRLLTFSEINIENNEEVVQTINTILHRPNPTSMMVFPTDFATQSKASALLDSKAVPKSMETQPLMLLDEEEEEEDKANFFDEPSTLMKYTPEELTQTAKKQLFDSSPNYTVLNNESGGDCFFAVVRDAFETIDETISVQELREFLYQAINNDEGRRYFDDLKEFVLLEREAIEQNINQIKANQAEILRKKKQLTKKSLTNNEKLKLAAEIPALEETTDDLISQTENRMNQVDTTITSETTWESFLEGVLSSNFWADEKTIRIIQGILDFEMLIVDTSNPNKAEFRCSVLNERPPTRYILANYTGNHYKLILYQNKGIFTFDELPLRIKYFMFKSCETILMGRGREDYEAFVASNRDDLENWKRQRLQYETQLDQYIQQVLEQQAKTKKGGRRKKSRKCKFHAKNKTQRKYHSSM